MHKPLFLLGGLFTRCVQNVYSLCVVCAQDAVYTHATRRTGALWVKMGVFVRTLDPTLPAIYSHNLQPGNTLVTPLFPALHTPYIKDSMFNKRKGN